MDSFGTMFFEIEIIKKIPYNFDGFNLEISNTDRDPDLNQGQRLGLIVILQAPRLKPWIPLAQYFLRLKSSKNFDGFA